MKSLSPTRLGLLASFLVALGSFGAGATRNRGGVMRMLGVDNLTYGHGRALMDITMSVGIVLLLLAWLWLWRTRPTFDTVRRTTWLWTAPLALSAPMLSRDVYSYLMQGAMLRDGFDPYSEGAAVNPGPLLWEVSHDWRNTTTPYGPLHLGLGKLITLVTGDSVGAGIVAYRLLALAGFALIIITVPKIAQQLGGDSAFALWIGATNPLMLLHMVGGMHNEAVMVGLVSVGIVWALRRPATFATFSGAIAVVAVAVSLKATAAVAMPFIVWLMVAHFAGASASVLKKCGVFILATAWSIALTGGVLYVVTTASGASWGWLAEISGNSKVINPLAGPTLVTEILTPGFQLFDDHFYYNSLLVVVRAAASILMLVALAVVWWWFRPKPGAANDVRAVQGTTAAYVAAFITNAVTLPWYYASILALVGTFRAPRWVQQVAVGASVIIVLAFTGGGNHRFYDAWFLVAAPFVAFAAVLAVWPFKQAKTPSPVLGE
ncbi:alpha-(1-_6)-mannopyranosyltransferase A [Corynebacterium sp. CCUG 51687]|uniref:alpha-(1->6)-mannopyranosyltransferase A n=1 Tax=Corynebacterium sp. CCUG 51687 TaxID=2823897 RepID=UPI00210D4134|nr:alpha-(1->6)-mannopyranosyltransferase A [Corynebacterium sp. CCUG 51687]MCQ4610973.1 alpha-(1->6)-mannopyranosyltransferase A [Corynebacterium sp. CCUG 51687]